ncbi:MAG: DUF3127 domain-containing protein [Planctomycetaceae bacterium]|nr:DUF3127 domain-containing protein [Planctomycetaceae bacterium]
MGDGKVRGIVHLIDETKTFGQKGFRKRLVVLQQDNGRFVNYVPLDFTQDDCDKADQLNVGDDVEVEFRLNGRKWQRDPSSEVKYFLNAEAMNFRVLGQNPAADASSVNDQFADAGQDDDEVPF